MNDRSQASSDRDWTAGVVGIAGRNRIVGTGFVVSAEGLLLTCAHVLADAGWSYEHWDEPVTVRFKASGRSARALVQQRCFKSQVDGDMALLALEDGLPAGVSVLPLIGSEGTIGHKVYMWGYPAGHEGLRGEGEVLGLVPRQGRDVLQLSSPEVTKGYSGGPIWDAEWGRVIGMTLSGTEADAMGRHAYTNFATPAEDLAAACPDALTLTPLDAAEAVDLDNFDARKLNREMIQRFNTAGVADLAFQLDIDYDDLPPGGKTTKIRELILYCERRKLVPELLNALEQELDSVDWYEISGARKI